MGSHEQLELFDKPCPFCGGTIEIGICDGEGNPRNEDYEQDPWSGLAYRILHNYLENKGCPIATFDDREIGVYLYDSREEAIEAWNTRV